MSKLENKLAASIKPGKAKPAAANVPVKAPAAPKAPVAQSVATPAAKPVAQPAAPKRPAAAKPAAKSGALEQERPLFPRRVWPD